MYNFPTNHRYRLFVAVMLLICYTSCTSDNGQIDINSGLVGTWLKTEELADPGDGSGEFQPIESNGTITFNANETFTSNENLCFSNSDRTSRGTYSFYNSTLSPDFCELNGSDYIFNFERQGTILILYYPCIEGCAFKYEKVED